MVKKLSPTPVFRGMNAPGYANDSRYSSAGDSSYHALLVSVAQRPVTPLAKFVTTR